MLLYLLIIIYWNIYYVADKYVMFYSGNKLLIIILIIESLKAALGFYNIYICYGYINFIE